MEKLNFRIVSKAGFLIALLGFFMPLVNVPLLGSLNGFQVAGNLSQFLGNNAVTNSLYALFFFSCIGGILFLLLLMKKNFNMILDWFVISISVISIIVIFSEISKVSNSVSDLGSSFGFSGAGRIAGDAISEYLGIGVYVVICGIIVALIAQFISFVETKEFAPIGNIVDEQPSLQFESSNAYIVKHPASFSIQRDSSYGYENIGMLSKNDIVSPGRIHVDYTYVVTKDGKKGWCLSSCIEKI